METHIKFKKGQQRKFIEDVLETSRLSINDLAKISSISPRNFRDWKREKLTMTEKAALILSENFLVNLPEPVNKMKQRWTINKSLKARVGGIAFKKKYGSPGTPEGRKKGGTKALKILRERGMIPVVKEFNIPDKSSSLAEFIGIMLGDGGITPLQLAITLNRVADKDYVFYVKTLSKKLFGEELKQFSKKNCLAEVLYYNGVNIVNFLVKSGLKVGNKVKQQVGVPIWIMNNKEYSKMCCRGLIDTDGCIVIHKYYVGGKQYFYKKLNFTNHSIPLAEFVYETLKKYGLHPKIVKNLEKRRVWLYNSKEVQKYLDLIGSSNQRLLKFKEGIPNGSGDGLLNHDV